MITPRERVRTALRHQQPDRTPYHIVFTKQMQARMAEYLGDPAFLDRIGNHFTILRRTDRRRVEVRPEHLARPVRCALGPYRRQGHRRGPGVPRVARQPPRLRSFPTPTIRRDLPPTPTCAGYPDTFVVTNVSFSLFERAWTLTGMETLLVAMMEPRSSSTNCSIDFWTSTCDSSHTRVRTTSTPSCSATTGASSMACSWARHCGASSSNRGSARCIRRSRRAASSCSFTAAAKCSSCFPN